MRNPDWTTLPTNPMERISHLLITNEVSDFVRLRAVCRPWRSSTAAMKSRIYRLCPRNWVMLSNPNSSPTAVRFFNTSTHKSFSFNLARYLENYSLVQSCDSLFLLKHKLSEHFALLNPFMRYITDLPSKVESNCEEAPLQLDDLIHKSRFSLSSVIVTLSSTIVLVSKFMNYLAWTKPGDQSWMFGEFKVQCSSNVLFYQDRLMAIDYAEGLVQINLANEIVNQPQVEVVIPGKNLSNLDDARYLVDCGEEIILVTFMPDDAEKQHFWESFVAYKLDLKEETYDLATDLGDRSIFIGENRTLSVSCDDWSSVPANTIYLCDLYYGNTACYNLGTYRIKYQSHKPFLRPSSLVKELIKYCLG
ncbi:F-box family protein [Rhynchospora pubera]|uniref:F-box family protein n=1 Tax=Rhynchospora pubera TaxID=906938 RepID=A0AAV8E3G6_9POAL|nr:F-box family protein [Rhynchospora pubera]